jgi:hypothetical protein
MKTPTRARATWTRYRPDVAALRRRVPRLLREGAPLWVLSATAIVVLVGVLLVAATTPGPAARGFAELRATPGACSLVPDRSLNALRCSYVSPNVYEIVFARDLSGSAPVATRSTCCPGLIAVSLSGTRSVRVAFARQRTYPVLAQVVVP